MLESLRQPTLFVCVRHERFGHLQTQQCWNTSCFGRLVEDVLLHGWGSRADMQDETVQTNTVYRQLHRRRSHASVGSNNRDSDRRLDVVGFGGSHILCTQHDTYTHPNHRGGVSMDRLNR